MITAYQPALATYDSHNHGLQHSFPGHGPGPGPSAGRAESAVTDAAGSQYYRFAAGQPLPQPHPQPQPQPHIHPQLQPQPQLQSQTLLVPSSQPSSSASLSAMQIQPLSRQSSRTSTPPSEAATTMPRKPQIRQGSEALVFHSTFIPTCISPEGGNLYEFAAQMTCLFWFESAEGLKTAESVRHIAPNDTAPPLPLLAKPLEVFRKWVYGVLSTTQVTQNVILLALLFIYRLKKCTPRIRGRTGSEYRLLTVALMLGNKFLDDNTYTNKTWAEVSCFSVKEIHIMEVEFLSNMRYNLLVSKQEWDGWLIKLASFREYYERAPKVLVSPAAAPSPGTSFHSPMSSPARAGLLQYPEQLPLPSTPSSVAHFSAGSGHHSQNWAAYQTNAVSPSAARSGASFVGSRKRSPELDFDLAENPAKRPAHLQLGHGAAPSMTARSNGSQHSGRLPVPQLTVITDPAPNQQPPPQHQHYQQQQPQYPNPGGFIPSMSGPNQDFVSLPPLQPGVRAMSTVYQPTPSTMVQQAALLASAGATMPPATAYHGAGLPSHPSMGYGPPSNHRDPTSLAPYASSPMMEFGPGTAVHTPISHTPLTSSPSYYLQQRASPYKPVRHVNTLLYPPPSASLDQYHLAVPVPPNQMHYQPLGRRNDVRTGVVPEYVTYNRGQQQQQQQQQQQPLHQPLHQPLPSQGPVQRPYLL